MERTFLTTPKIGLVVGTFAAIPYVHLHLECRRRYFPTVPLLVNDDGSAVRDQLAALCKEYGVDFLSNSSRRRQMVGDLSAYVHGFDWATEHGLDVLAKMSRRFIPFFDWIPGLQRLAMESQMATFSHSCDHFNFGFRTECIAFHCESWRRAGAYQSVRNQVESNTPIFVEAFIHGLARDVARTEASDAGREYAAFVQRPSDRDGYAEWNIMASRRPTRRPEVLWHDADAPFDYWRAARIFGLNYEKKDFEDPNSGYGVGEA